MRCDLLGGVDQRIAGHRARGIGGDAAGDFGTGFGLRRKQLAAHLGGRGLGFEEARNQVGSPGQRAGLGDFDGVGHAQRAVGREFEVIAIASQLLVFAALYQLSDGIQNVSVGILRGIQDVKIIMPIAFVSYWLLNLPVGYLFGFTLGMGPTGLFLGFSFGLSAAAVMMIVRIRRSVRKLRLGN